MAWTAPHTWVVGELIDAATLNTEWRDNVKYLTSDIPAFRARHSVNQNVNNGATLTVAFDTTEFDFGSCKVSNTLWQASRAGVWRYSTTIGLTFDTTYTFFTVSVNTPVAGNFCRQSFVKRNNGTGEGGTTNLSGVVKCALNDQASVQVAHGDTNALVLNAVTAYIPIFTGYWMRDL